jgi:hypothetical protein
MTEQPSLNDLKEIKTLMGRAKYRIERNAGWFFILWGIIWAMGFAATQFYPDQSGVIWITLNAAGIIGSTVLGAFLFGKRSSHAVTGLGPRIAASGVGSAYFGFLLGFLLKLQTGREITILIVVLAALVYFYNGLFAGIWLSALGVLLAAAVFAADLFFPSAFYLAIGISCGSLVLGSGLFVLFWKGE